MIKTGDLNIHYKSIPERIQTYFGKNIKDQHELDTWDFDLRNQTLLHRNAVGYYEFAHKSLAEYFVALKFAAELDVLDEVFSKTYFEINGKQCLMPFKVKNITELTDTFGLISLTSEQMNAVYNFLSVMMSDSAVEKLLDLIYSTRGKSLESINYTGGNAATLLQIKRKSFARIDLANTILKGASLEDSDFNSSNLEHICLQECNVENCSFENSYINGSDLSHSNFENCNLNETSIKHCNLQNSKISDTTFENADMCFSNFSSSFLYKCSMIDSKMNDCDLTSSLLESNSLLRTNMKNAILDGIQVIDPTIQYFIWCNGGKHIVAHVSDGSVRIWNALTGQPTRTFQTKLKFPRYGKIICEINHTDFLAITALENDNIFILDIKKGTLLKCELKENRNATNRLYSSPSGRYISSSHGGFGIIKIWDALSGIELSSFKAQEWCNAAYLLNNEKLVLSTGIVGEIRTWNWESQELISSFAVKDAKNMYDLQMTANQDIVGATMSKETFGDLDTWGRKILIWSYPNFEPIFSLDMERKDYKFNLSPEGSYIAVVNIDYNKPSSLALHNLNNGQKITLIENSTETIHEAKFSFDGRFLAVHYYSTIQILKIDTEKLKTQHCIVSLIAKTNCQEMQIDGASGLCQEIECSVQGQKVKQTLLQFLLDRGAKIEQ